MSTATPGTTTIHNPRTGQTVTIPGEEFATVLDRATGGDRDTFATGIMIPADVSFGSLLDWERQARRVTAAVESKFSVLVRETSGYRAGEPPVRRRQPHPDYAILMERCRPLMLAHPVRSAWKNGRRS